MCTDNYIAFHTFSIRHFKTNILEQIRIRIFNSESLLFDLADETMHNM